MICPDCDGQGFVALAAHLVAGASYLDRVDACRRCAQFAELRWLIRQQELANIRLKDAA